MSYAALLESKKPAEVLSGIESGLLHPSLFDFQAALVRWALRRGRAAVFCDTGLGKTRIQLEWLRQIAMQNEEFKGLIVAPLAVAEQTIREASQIGLSVEYAKTQPASGGYWITNYERLDNFDPAGFDASVLDESSILKSFDGRTRGKLISEWSSVPLRLCCTATPAPNDMNELANHAEYLGIMRRSEMLATFFVHDENHWRLKGHAAEPFYRWLATWAMYVRRPSDLGFDDTRFNLPRLEVCEHMAEVNWEPSEGELFPAMAGGIQGRRIARRGSLAARVNLVAAMLSGGRDPALVWCDLNDEGRMLKAALGDAAVLIEGSDSADEKIAREHAWRTGEARVMITKPSIFGFGMNWQHCAHVLFLGIGDSWESYYQAIRRCWRYGQKRPVVVDIVLSEAEQRVLENIRRKETEAQRTAEEVVAAMRDYEREEITGAQRKSDEYRSDEAEGDGWTLKLGDSVERLREIAAGSVGLSVFSPPFSALYTYSNSERDLGNCRDYEEFFRHFDFVIPELLRVTAPGRRACVHVQQVTMTKATHGVIGWFDFRADVVRHFVAAGWVYDGEVVIDKDPQAQAIRTKSKALMFVQKNKDSAWSRPAMADYILLFRAPGENAVPVDTNVSNEEWILWARPIWYGIRESGTLQAASARENKDERHICPLQLETIERCVRLWSNPGDLVLDPFSGIGSTGFVAVRHGRKSVGIELKPAYWRQGVINMKRANMQESLFTEATE
jgi:DNA modification methylase